MRVPRVASVLVWCSICDRHIGREADHDCAMPDWYAIARGANRHRFEVAHDVLHDRPPRFKAPRRRVD